MSDFEDSPPAWWELILLAIILTPTLIWWKFQDWWEGRKP